MQDWNEFKTKVQQQITELKNDKFGDFSSILNKGLLFDSYQSLFSERIRFKLLNQPDDFSDDNPHQAGIEELDGKTFSQSLVAGALDAENDPLYNDVYKSLHWRTVIYFYLDISQHAVPGVEEDAKTAIHFKSLAAFYSFEPDAIDAPLFFNLYSVVYLFANAQILRFGFTLSSTQAKRLWQAFPGANCILSSEYAFDMNQELEDWFDIRFNRSQAVKLENFLPLELRIWIKAEIDSEEKSRKEKSHIFEMKIKKDQSSMVEATLKPYRLFEYLNLHSAMNFPYDDITTDQLDRKLHLLMLKDVSDQWRAEMLRNEIELAKRLQKSMLPGQLPKAKNFDVAANCIPAGHIGGDLFDVILMPDHSLVVFLTDATGHGMNSALLAATGSGAFRTAIYQDSDHERVLDSINQTMNFKRERGFLTIAYLKFEPDGGAFTYSLAGHHPPVVFKKSNQSVISIQSSSLPIGVKLGRNYYIRRENLDPGDIIGAFSDGLLEMRNVDGCQFEAEIETILKHNQEADSSAILDLILDEAASFRYPQPQDDDLTAVLVKII